MMACYLVNRSPSTAIEKNTPQEVWSGSPVDYYVIKIFGCASYAHVDNRKLAPRSVNVCFLALNLVSRAISCGVLRTRRSFIVEMLSLMRLLC